ncbi:LacI family DNA-binding transcriptional regulator [Bacillus sp. Marseille-P3661]|uniref:LacI family DNA-binding transcriptional regulator n=1 Tax=Bacillus sp. Marseille-P3661 TaxID=1936234 RepID=UPI000C81ADB2|nr:substrate-binding domain-containing protein [Bacillus sp. Marseille-P3661]
MKTITITDVAKHANVSKSTVSQFLNKRYDYMSVKTKKRIEEAVEELGYTPNFVARSLKQKSTSTIGVIVANILHAFSTQVIRAIEDVCNEDDFHIIVCNADDEPEKEKKYIEMLLAKQVDGLIIFPTGDNLDLYQGMVEKNFPVVFVDRMVSNVPITTVLLDNEQSSRLAVDYLVSKGYTQMGIITPPIIRNVTPRVERLNAFKKSLQEFGIQINESYIKSLDVQQIKHELEKMHARKMFPQALLAANDLALVEILKFAKENHIKIPTDVAVIGIDDVNFASFYSPPLTTIAQPSFEIGTKAAKVLLDKIRDKNEVPVQQIFRLPPKLIIRESC